MGGGEAAGIKASREAGRCRAWGLRWGGGDGKARRIQSWRLDDGVTEVGGCLMCPGDNSFLGGIVMCVELVFQNWKMLEGQPTGDAGGGCRV